jgi:hypothetical protein
MDGPGSLSVNPFLSPSGAVSQPVGTKRKRLQDFEAGASNAEDVCYLEEHQRLLLQPPPVSQSPTSPVPVSQSAGTKRELLQDSEAETGIEIEANEPEDVRPSKQPRDFAISALLEEEKFPRDPQTEADEEELPPSKELLSEKNLQLFNAGMEGAVHRPASIKRTLSRRSLATEAESESIRSQRSSSTTAHYRYKHLKAANVYIHVDPPEDIQTAINDIICVKPSEDRCALINEKANKFWKRCRELVQAAAGEGDFVSIFHTIAEQLSPDNFIFRKEADWRAELKPTIQQSAANLSILWDFKGLGSDEQQNIDDTSAPPPPKRHLQSADRLYISPRSSRVDASMAPPDNKPLPPAYVKETFQVKTPRPDITAGIEESALASALASSLSSQKFNYTKAEKFLDDLQNTVMPTEDGSQQPAMIIVPTQRDSNLTFPTLVFEGKGYSTGKQVFEAQNQAAVSGAGGVKMQIMLDELVERATRSSATPFTPSKNRPSLVFSICTEGPYHELWAHYTVIKDGERQFNMMLLDTCHGVVLKQVERFFIQVDNVMTWTVGTFLQAVVERLAEVAKEVMLRLSTFL